ncbi:MAG: hypothetical protein ACXWJW_09020 [Xanthobacteraceae bacterium]
MNASRQPYYPKPERAAFAMQAVGALIVVVLFTVMIISAQHYFGGPADMARMHRGSVFVAPALMDAPR